MTHEKISENTQLRLAYAMYECMKKNNVETITVREICQQASCSRQTFYRCFEDKYALINWYFDRILHESFRRMGQGRTVKDGLIQKFHYIQDEHLFFKAAFSTDTQNNLRQHDFDMIFHFYIHLIEEKSHKPIPNQLKDILDMYCYASVYKTVQWVLSDSPISPEALADTMLKAMPTELSTLFEQLQILT